MASRKKKHGFVSNILGKQLLDLDEVASRCKDVFGGADVSVNENTEGLLIRVSQMYNYVKF